MSAGSRGARAALVAGAALGVALAVRGVVRPSRVVDALPATAVALVGDTPISEAEYSRAIAAVESDRRDHQVEPELRRHVLDRLVEEELLVQGALELGLPTRDPRLRGQIATTMLDGVVGEPLPAPDDATLRAFHEARAASFTRRGRVQIDALFFRGERAASRADAARTRLAAGEPFAAVAADADPVAIPLPQSVLPAAKLAEYVGPGLAQAVERLPVGGLSAPVIVDGGAWVAQLVAREDGEIAPYEDVREEVLAEWRREADDKRLRRWLDQRRSATRVLLRAGLE